MKLRLPAVSYGATSAIVTSTGLIVGFAAADVPRRTLVAALLIVGLADNITDSLSIHIYQESERLEERAAFRATLGNFATRAAITLSFVALTLWLSGVAIVVTATVWGVMLLSVLTWLVAVQRQTNPRMEIARHLAVAAAVIVVSRLIGMLINGYGR